MSGFTNNVCKIYLTIDDQPLEYKYISIVNPITNEKIMKIKHNLDDQPLIDFLDTFFDAGFKVVLIDEWEFDDLKTNDILKYNI